MQKLKRNFFNQNCLTVSQQLIGKMLFFAGHIGIITETEAYIGYADDLACHAHNRRTMRTDVMFGPAGFSYIYLIYGMYHCLNIVTEQDGRPAATLIRGLKLLTPPVSNLNGPGKICKALDINLIHNKIDITTQDDFYIADVGLVTAYLTTPRIGISKAIDKPWRYVADYQQIKIGLNDIDL